MDVHLYLLFKLRNFILFSSKLIQTINGRFILLLFLQYFKTILFRVDQMNIKYDLNFYFFCDRKYLVPARCNIAGL